MFAIILTEHAFEKCPPLGRRNHRNHVQLIGEKFLNFIEAADDDADVRAEILAFVAEIKSIFEPWQLAAYLEIARQTEPFDPSVYDDNEEAEMERQSELRRSAADLMLVERSRDWLLENER